MLSLGVLKGRVFHLEHYGVKMGNKWTSCSIDGCGSNLVGLFAPGPQSRGVLYEAFYALTLGSFRSFPRLTFGGLLCALTWKPVTRSDLGCIL